MKKPTILLYFLLIVFSVSGQQLDVIYNDEGIPAILKVWGETVSKNIVLNDIPEDGCIRFDFEGTDITVNFNTLKYESPAQSVESTEYTIQEYEPGHLPEGDLVSGIELSSDGSLIFVAHRHSGNIFVYDSETYETMAIINTARGIIDMKVTDSSLFVCCRDTKQLFIIDRTDYSIKNSFPIDVDACQMDVNPEETIVVIAFDSYLDGWMKAYNAETGHEIFYTAKPFIHTYSTTTRIVGRYLLKHYEFDLSPHGNHFIAHSTSGNSPQIFDINTGEVIKTLNQDNLQVSQYSSTGDTLYILTMNSVPELTLRRIDCNDYSTIDSLVVDIHVIIASPDMAISKDGAKVFIPCAYDDTYFVFDFNEDTCHIYSPSIWFGGTPNIAQSPDKRYVFIRHFVTYQVFDLETNQFRGQFPHPTTYGSRACAAMDGNRLFVSKPGFQYQPELNEGMLVMNYTDPDNVFIDTLHVSGDLPEADLVSSAVISYNGDKLYAANTISANLSIIDIATQTTDTIYQLPASYERITLVPKSDLIFLSDIQQSTSLLFNPVTLETVAELNVPRTRDAIPSPDGHYIYALSNTDYLSKVEVDGENSGVVEKLLVNGYRNCSMHYMWGRILVDNPHTSFALSPDGNYIICGIKDTPTGDNFIDVIETETLESVAKIQVEDACIWDYAFTSDSKRVCALSYKIEKPIIYLDGENSFLESLVPDFKYAYSVQYNPVDSLFYILNDNPDYWKVDPLTGEKIEEVIISKNFDISWQLVLDENNKPIIRQNTEIVYDGVDYNLPGISKAFYYSSGYNVCVIPIPGPDAVCVFNPLYVGVKKINNPGLQSNLQVYPNPAHDNLTISSEALFNMIEVIDSQGKLIYKGKFNNFKTSIHFDDLKPGVYFVRVHIGTQVESKKLVVL
jgi:DNA-binding beta-propeller fold protein YncE